MEWSRWMQCSGVEWNGVDGMQCSGVEWNGIDGMECSGMSTKNWMWGFSANPTISIFRKWLIFFLFARRVRKWPQTKGVPKHSCFWKCVFTVVFEYVCVVLKAVLKCFFKHILSPRGPWSPCNRYNKCNPQWAHEPMGSTGFMGPECPMAPVPHGRRPIHFCSPP